MPTIVAVVLVALLALAAAGAVAWPLLHAADDAPGEPGPSDARRALDDEIERSLAAIREIEFDRRAGNLSDDDFAALNAQERARAAELLRRRDAMAVPPERPGSISAESGR